MADCDDALRELYTYLDGELTDGVRHAVARHLDACQDCLEVFDFQVELRAVISSKCRESLPPGLLDRLKAALDGESGALA